MPGPRRTGAGRQAAAGRGPARKGTSACYCTRPFTIIIVTIAVSLILQNCLLAIWESYGLLRYIRLGKAMRAAASDPATWRGPFSLILGELA
jgi:branched-subunit amino acid ABC-type transport system permease component